MNGDEDSRAFWLSTKVLPHESSIRRIIGSWRLPAELEVEDVIQEAYAKIARLPSVAHILSPRTYFLQTARSVLLMHVRRARLVSIDVLADLAHLSMSEGVLSPEMHVSDREQLKALADAVTQMEEPSRSMFILRMVHDLSHKAIGQQIGLSENAVQKMLARALCSLAEKIGRSGPGSDQAPQDAGHQIGRRK